MQTGNYTPMLARTLFSVKAWKQSKCPSKYEWVKMETIIHLCKDEILSFKTTWMALETSMLSEISQA